MENKQHLQTECSHNWLSAINNLYLNAYSIKALYTDYAYDIASKYKKNKP